MGKKFFAVSRPFRQIQNYSNLKKARTLKLVRKNTIFKLSNLGWRAKNSQPTAAAGCLHSKLGEAYHENKICIL